MSDMLTPEEIEEGLRAIAVARGEDSRIGDTYRAINLAAANYGRALRQLQAQAAELEGYRKSYALLQKGMESQAELMDGLKQSERTARALAARLAVMGNAVKNHWPDAQPGSPVAEYLTAIADARAAGLTKETT